MARALTVLVAPCIGVVAIVAAASCANDFESLFDADSSVSPPPAEASTTDPPTTDDSGSTEPPTSVDSGPPEESGAADTGPVACTPVANCNGSSTHVCQNGNRDCVNQCTACGCKCPRQDCGAGNSDSCKSTCMPGTTCDIDCNIEGACQLESHNATAKMVCRDDDSDVCTATCDQGGSCEVGCENNGGCTITCGAGTQCLVRCKPGDSVCEKMAITCPVPPKSCANDTIIVCNRDCP